MSFFCFFIYDDIKKGANKAPFFIVIFLEFRS